MVEDLRTYARDLDREAFLFEQQAAEFRRRLATTRRLSEEVKELSETACQLLAQMQARLKKAK